MNSRGRARLTDASELGFEILQVLRVGDPKVEVRISALVDDVAGVRGADGQDRRRAVGALRRAEAVRALHGGPEGRKTGKRGAKDGHRSRLLARMDAEICQ